MTKDGQTTVTKVWTCEDVPGGQVKMEMKGQGVTVMTSSGELIEIGEAKADDSADDDSDDDGGDDGDAAGDEDEAKGE